MVILAATGRWPSRERLLSILTLLVAFLAGGCGSLVKVEDPVEPGEFYVLDGSRQIVRFEFFPSQPGLIHVVKTVEFKGEGSGEEPGGPTKVNVFFLADAATGQIRFCPDLPRDVGEHTRAFLPRVPRAGKAIELGTPGDAVVSGDASFLCLQHGFYEHLGRSIPVVILNANLGAREDTIYYSTKAGIVVYARFLSGLGEDEFRLVETNIPLD